MVDLWPYCTCDRLTDLNPTWSEDHQQSGETSLENLRKREHKTSNPARRKQRLAEWEREEKAGVRKEKRGEALSLFKSLPTV